MRFADALKHDEPAYEIFNAAMAVVFDQDDPNTEHVERLSPQARLVYLLWCLDGEVNNGGFDQLFFNSLGDRCGEMPGYLQEVGAMRVHGLLARAMAWFPGAAPARDRDDRQAQLESFCEEPKYQAEIERLNSAFYENEDRLTSLLHDYVRRNPDASVRG